MKNVLADRLGTTEKVCTLCGDEDESSMHLFKNCQAVRALAFGSWGLRMDNWNVNCISDLIQSYCEPSKLGWLNRTEMDEVTSFLSALFYKMWMFRND